MAIALALASALSYGVSDYLAGSSSRRWDSRLVTALNGLIGLLTAILAVIVLPGSGPASTALLWGGISGIGSAIGVLALYRGLAAADMSIVAPVCGVLTAVIPAAVGVLLGDRLTAVELIGIVLTIPAVGLVSRQPSTRSGDGGRAGLLYGLVAGAGFGLLFVALDQAGTHHGAWPLLPGQTVSLLLTAPFAVTAIQRARRPPRPVLLVTLLAGVLSGGANLLYLLATHYGELAIVGVISSLYPAGTVLLARVRLHENWGRIQKLGLLSALVAVLLVAS